MKPSNAVRDRLLKLCGMFGSDFDGERANAARMASDLLVENGLTWNDVLGVDGAQVSKGRPSTPLHVKLWEIRETLHLSSVITDWEYKLLGNVYGRDLLTEKQQVIVDRIYAKVQRRGFL